MVHEALGLNGSPVQPGLNPLDSLRILLNWIEVQVLLTCPGAKRINSQHPAQAYVNPATPNGNHHHHRNMFPTIFNKLKSSELMKLAGLLAITPWTDACIAAQISIGTIVVIEQVPYSRTQALSIDIVQTGPFLGNGGW